MTGVQTCALPISSHYAMERVSATAADGTRVPVTLLYRKGFKRGQTLGYQRGHTAGYSDGYSAGQAAGKAGKKAAGN